MTDRLRSVDRLLPLKPKVLHVLLAVADGPRHGYSIMQEVAERTDGQVRVNALMPGFFLGDQNRRLLTNDDGSLTERGRLIVQNTPFGRFGEADELHGAIHYLVADASKFVTGTVLAVDGGFTAFSGV